MVENILQYSEYYVDVNKDMLFVIGCYHDLGLSKGRDLHEYYSKQRLLRDPNLKRWFTIDQIRVMANAVEDHRASLEYEPRSIYGKLISEADRVIDPERTIERCARFNHRKYPEATREGLKEYVRKYLIGKYVQSGNIKEWIPESGNKAKLGKFKSILLNSPEFEKIFDKVYRNS